MPENEVDIGIRVSADSKQVVEMTKAVKAMQDQLSHVPENMKKVDAAANTTDETTKKLGGSMVKLKDLTVGLGMEFPVLGKVIGFLTNPITLVVAATASLIQTFAKFYADAAASIARWNELGAAIRKAGEDAASLVEAKKTIEAFNETLAKSGKSSDPIGAKLQSDLAVVNAEGEAKKKAAEAIISEGGNPAQTPEQISRQTEKARANLMIRAGNAYSGQKRVAESGISAAATELGFAKSQAGTGPARIQFAQDELKAAQAESGTGVPFFPWATKGFWKAKGDRIKAAESNLATAKKFGDVASGAQSSAAMAVAELTASGAQGASGVFSTRESLSSEQRVRDAGEVRQTVFPRMGKGNTITEQKAVDEELLRRLVLSFEANMGENNTLNNALERMVRIGEIQSVSIPGLLHRLTLMESRFENQAK